MLEDIKQKYWGVYIIGFTHSRWLGEKITSNKCMTKRRKKEIKRLIKRGGERIIISKFLRNLYL